MASVYHIVAIRVNETSWAHVWRLRFCYLRTGYDTRYVRCLKSDSPVCQTGYSIFDRIDDWDIEKEFWFWRGLGQLWRGDFDINHIGSHHLENQNSWYFFEAWNSMSFEFIHLWTYFDDLIEKKDIQGIRFKNKRIVDLKGIFLLMSSQ
jgi:hypothetical protein